MGGRVGPVVAHPGPEHAGVTAGPASGGVTAGQMTGALLEVDGNHLEVAQLPASTPGGPVLVLLHEGLGCVGMWRDVPSRLAAATGAGVVAYSRCGYGRSGPLTGPRTPDYMHHEALVVLPQLLDRLGIARPVLVGHSDGASIAIIHAGDGRWAPAGLVLMAPHVFVEDRSIQGIDAAAEAYRTTDLARRLGRYHRDPDATFWGWNRIWLSADFATWNIERALAGVGCPVLVVQGTNDPYGTLAQVGAIEAGVTGPVQRLVLDGCGHAPHRDRPETTLAAITTFYNRLTPAH